MSVMKYPINSKAADPILTPEFEIISLNEIRDVLLSSSVPQQIELCKRLGISFTQDSVSLSIYEKGKAYLCPDEDRTKICDCETSHEIQLTFSVANCDAKFPLPLSVNLGECTNQVFVNFFGEIIFVNHQTVEVSVPLIGRGTVALEARENDAHAEPCIGGNCASFQQKIAILSSILGYFHITRDEIEILRAHLLKVCEKYYGRNDILNYTLDKAFSLTNVSYYEYLKNIYKDEDEDNIPIMLQHFTEFAEPHPMYFMYLKEALTPEELTKELIDTTHDPKGPDKHPITPRVREIINEFIFLDEIYLVKPYPGKPFKCDDEDVSIYTIERQINNNSLGTIKAAFESLGVTIEGDKINVRFLERGKKFVSVRNMNLVQKEETEEVFELNFNLPSTCLDSLLRLKLYLDINPIDNVNFFGKIEIKNGFFFKTIIPLLGRGTICLEGKLNDEHCGFCIGPEAASFQQKVALIYSCLVLLGVNEQDLLKFEYAVKRINKMFYEINDIIEYTFKVVRQQEKSTFFSYMKSNYVDFSKMPIALKTILTYNRLPPKYFESLIKTFTEKELTEEESRIRTIRLSNVIPKLIRNISGILVKINIF